MKNKIRKAIREQIKKLKETMSPEEWEAAKEADRLDQHPEKDTISKIKKMMDKEKEEMHDDPGDIRIDHDYYANEDYKPSLRAYDVIDKSKNDEIVAKGLPRWKAIELAKTKEEYMFSPTDRLAETRPDWTPPPMGMGGEEKEDEEQEEYDKGWYGESLREAATELGYLGEISGMEGEDDPEQTTQYQKVEFVYSEQGGRFYGLNVYTSEGQKSKLRYDEANEWLKDTLEYIHDGDLIPRHYGSGLEDLDLIIDRLRELNIEASHNEYDFS